MHTHTHTQVLHYLGIRLAWRLFCFFFPSKIQFIFWSCLPTLLRNALAKHSSNAGGISGAEGCSGQYCSLSDFSTGLVRRILAHEKTKFCFLPFETFKTSIWTLDPPISSYSVPEVRAALVSPSSSEGNPEKWTSASGVSSWTVGREPRAILPWGSHCKLAPRPQQKQEASTYFVGLVW